MTLSHEAVGEMLAKQLRLSMARNGRLVLALRKILDTNAEFRAGMPPHWEGDPLQDVCAEAEQLLKEL